MFECADAPMGVVFGKIEFEKVSFAYDTEDGPALNNVSFTAKAGTVTALVGPSGGGKSTIMNMIPRFYDPKDGAVKVDGIPADKLNLKFLRDNIAPVSQDITIFDDTIAANIAYGKNKASQADIEKAAKAAAAHDFIKKITMGDKQSFLQGVMMLNLNF